MYHEITYIELIEIFLSYTIPELKNQTETPNINFVFGKDGYKLFDEIINDGDYRLHHIHEGDVNFLNEHSNDNCISINVHDAASFFKYLTEIVNETLKLTKEYNDQYISREGAMYLLRRIWLRMSPSDVENIDAFLKKQLEFVKNRTLDIYNPVNYGSFDKYTITMRTKSSDFWDESTRQMIYTIEGDNESYELPHILYDIDDNGVCYLFAVQSSKKDNKSKKIERKLYQFNKGVKKTNVHPSKTASLFLFIHQLKRMGINKIIVPGIQVLSYDYHKLLNISLKEELDKAFEEYQKNPDNKYAKSRYEYIKSNFDTIYGKQDKISYLKTQQLYRVVEILTELDPSIQIMNDVMIQGDSMDVRL